MKKIIRFLMIVAIIIYMSATLSACGTGAKEKQPSTSSEQTQEGGAQQDNEHGSESIELEKELKWPSELMSSLPEPKGKITAVMSDEATKQCTVVFKEMSKEDAKAYVIKIEELGYAGGLKVSDTDLISINGENVTGARVDFLYNVSPKEGTISFRPKDTAKDSNHGVSETSSAGSVDMTDLAPWPSEYMDGVPELQGKITDLVKNDDSVSVDLEYVDKTDFENYVNQLKENGYTEDIDETSGLSAIDFRAYNKSGDWVHAYWTADEDKSMASVMMEKVN